MVTVKWKFGERSKDRLATCDRRLIELCTRVLKASPFDLTVLEGHRSLERQVQLFDAGMSKLNGTTRKSRHQKDPSMAVDIAPFPVNWEDTRRFYLLAGLMISESKRVAMPLRWGGDWDGDGEFTDQSFHDLPHYEIKDLL